MRNIKLFFALVNKVIRGNLNYLITLITFFIASTGVSAQTLKEALRLTDNEQAAITEANSDFQRALDATKMKDAAVLMEVGEALTQASNKDLPRALDLLNKAIAIEPKNTQILIRIGNVYIEQRNGNFAAE